MVGRAGQRIEVRAFRCRDGILGPGRRKADRPRAQQLSSLYKCPSAGTQNCTGSWGMLLARIVSLYALAGAARKAVSKRVLKFGGVSRADPL